MGWYNPPTQGGTFVNPVIASSTWAALPAAPATGALVWVSNGGTPGSLWRYNGTRWKLVNGIANFATLDAVSSNIANADTIVFQYQFPATLPHATDFLRIRAALQKSGATDGANINFRLGTAGTIADTLIGGGIGTMNAGNRTGTYSIDWRFESATSILAITNSGVTTPQSGYSNASNSAAAAAVTIANVSNSLFFSISIQSSSTNDTVALRQAQLDYLTSAN